MKTIALFPILIVAMTACSSTVSPQLVTAKAASDLSCPANEVKAEQVTGNNWKATGCGKRATYMCSGSNFMSDGLCMREGEPQTNPGAGAK